MSAAARLPVFVLTAALLVGARPAAATGEPRRGLSIWRLAGGVVTPDEGADEPRAVGSLQKAWVLAAWAVSHPDSSTPLPRVVCDGNARCWLAAGHGQLGLRAAAGRSCNAYFRELARQTPVAVRQQVFRRAGFESVSRLPVDAAIGLAGRHGPRMTPRQLLAAYAELVTSPWSERDDARREWLDGMRDAAEDGTAAGIPLRGFLAKTGTVPSETRTLGVDGWALVMDPAGRSGWLAFDPGVPGSAAATRLGEVLASELPAAVAKPARPAKPPPSLRRAPPRPPARFASSAFRETDDVRVRLFRSLEGAQVTARNLGPSPVGRAPGRGWAGAGAEVLLLDGERLERGTWELSVAPYGFTRVVRGALERESGSLVLVTSRRDYVEGVIRGELRSASTLRAEELAAAILRFLADGPRHGTEDVCDLTHCARFVGLGPDVEWLTPVSARPSSAVDPLVEKPYLDAAAWSRVRQAALSPGPWTWTGHCGGEALSAHAVWGSGDRSVAPCPRHAGSTQSTWTRTLPDRDLAALFGGAVASLEAVENDGVRSTRVSVSGSSRLLLYDDLHRLIAERLGWSALPSPPDSFERVPGGWLARGRGSGHRVGICLAN